MKTLRWLQNRWRAWQIFILVRSAREYVEMSEEALHAAVGALDRALDLKPDEFNIKFFRLQLSFLLEAYRGHEGSKVPNSLREKV